MIEMTAAKLRWRHDTMPVADRVPMFQRAVAAIATYRDRAIVPHPKIAHLLSAARDEKYERGVVDPVFWYGADTSLSPSIGLLSDTKHPELRFTVGVPAWHQMAAWGVEIAPRPDDQEIVSQRPEISFVWEYSLWAVPRLVDALRPHHAVLGPNIVSGDLARASDALPKGLHPWNWFSDEALSTYPFLRGAIESLPDVVFEPLAGGLVVQVVPDLYHKPSKAFLEALAAIPVEPKFRYHQSKAQR